MRSNERLPIEACVAQQVPAGVWLAERDRVSPKRTSWRGLTGDAAPISVICDRTRHPITGMPGRMSVLKLGEGEDDKAEPKAHKDTPPAGPHDRPDLTNPDATPGTGMLPPIGTPKDPNMQPTG
jgi:hypothetical protein